MKIKTGVSCETDVASVHSKGLQAGGTCLPPGINKAILQKAERKCPALESLWGSQLNQRGFWAS